MPEWLPRLLIEFPAVVVMGGIFWYTVKWLAEQTDRELRRAEVLYDRNLTDARRDQAAHLTSKEQELARLRDDLRQEVRAVGRKVDALARKLS